MKLFQRKKDVTIKDIRPDVIYSPLHGIKKPLEDVEDMVFSSKMMGDGIAIEPLEGMLYSPVNGSVTVVFPTKHVIGLCSEQQRKVILHVGIDTVELQGEGFQTFVKVGDHVKAGQLLMKFDLERISRQHAPTTMVVLEPDPAWVLENLAYGETAAGEELMKIKRV